MAFFFFSPTERVRTKLNFEGKIVVKIVDENRVKVKDVKQVQNFISCQVWPVT